MIKKLIHSGSKMVLLNEIVSLEVCFFGGGWGGFGLHSIYKYTVLYCKLR